LDLGRRVWAGGRGIGVASLALGLLMPAGLSVGLAAQTTNSLTPLQVVEAMVAHEDDEAAHKDRYEFLSNERSDRTGGQMWTERVAEIKQGRVRYLVAVDGKPLTLEQDRVERGRLAGIVADPEAFVAREQTQKDDEAQARKMLDLLPKAFVFDNVRLQDGVWRMDFHPNPVYTPHGLQERVLYGMSGTIAIDAKAERLMHVEGVLKQDVSIGFGILATIKAGSRFSSDRGDRGGHWRTLDVMTDIRGKAILFKSVAKNSEITRSEFKYLEPGVTIAQAVELVESSYADGESARVASGG
jgi:hypothetical protein